MDVIEQARKVRTLLENMFIVDKTTLFVNTNPKVNWRVAKMTGINIPDVKKVDPKDPKEWWCTFEVIDPPTHQSVGLQLSVCAPQDTVLNAFGIYFDL